MTKPVVALLDTAPPGHGQGKVPAGDAAAQGRAPRRRDVQSLGFGRLLTVERAAEYIGASPWLVRQYLQTGELPVTRLPRPRTASALRSGPRRPMGDTLCLTLIDREALDEWIATRCYRECLTVGVFPLPPTVRLPTLTTRAGTCATCARPRS